MSKLTHLIAGLGMVMSLGMTPAVAQGATTPGLMLSMLPGHGWKYATLQFRAREEFRLGILTPATGPDAQAGTEIKNGVSLAFEAVHWHLGKYKILPYWIDAQSDPSAAVKAYDHAVTEDHIHAALQCWDSAVAQAVMEVSSKRQTPCFMDATGNAGQTPYGCWTQSTRPAPEQAAAAYVQALQDAIKAGSYHPAQKTVCICAEDTDYGRSAAKGFEVAFTRAGWTVLGQERFPAGQRELRPMLDRFKALNPEVVCATGTAALTGLARQAAAAGCKGLLIADGPGPCGAWYRLTGATADFTPDPPAWRTIRGKTFAAAYKEAYGSLPNPATAGAGYDTAQFFITMANEIISEGSDLTQETIATFLREELRTGKWTAGSGLLAPFPVFQYYGGAAKLVAP